MCHAPFVKGARRRRGDRPAWCLAATRREATRGGGDHEPGESDDEDAPPTEAITQRAADEEKGAQGEEVRIHRPLHPDEACLQAATNRWQRDIHNRLIEERDARSEHDSEERTAPGRTAES